MMAQEGFKRGGQDVSGRPADELEGQTAKRVAAGRAWRSFARVGA